MGLDEASQARNRSPPEGLFPDCLVRYKEDLSSNGILAERGCLL